MTNGFTAKEICDAFNEAWREIQREDLAHYRALHQPSTPNREGPLTYRLQDRTKDPATAHAAVARQAASLSSLAGRVHLDDKFVAMATNLGYGFWVTCYDRIFIGPEGRLSMGRAEDPPGHLTVEGQNVEWSVELALRPLLLMKVKHAVTPPSLAHIAPMADLMGADYTKIWRIGYQSFMRDAEPTEPPFVTEGTTLGYDLQFGWFRNGADPLDLAKMGTLNTHVNFEYPGRTDLGAPVVLADGRLAAVIIGGDLGPESAHQASIIPVELILPFRDLWRARLENFKDFRTKFHFSIHHGILE